MLYLDIKRDAEMEYFCRGNIAITYAYEPDHIAKEVSDIADEIYTRTNSISDMEEYGVEKEHDLSLIHIFNQVGNFFN